MPSNFHWNIFGKRSTVAEKFTANCETLLLLIFWGIMRFDTNIEGKFKLMASGFLRLHKKVVKSADE